MDTCSPPPAIDLAIQLPIDAYHQIVHTARGDLPRPITDAPEDLARRDNEFIAQLACMLPGNIDEARLAAQYIFAQAQAADLLRLARETDDTNLIVKCSVLSNSMMRQANATRRLFTQLQAARQKREADPKTRDQAAWTEHAAVSLMAAALDHPPPAPPLEPEPPPLPEAPPLLESEDKFRAMPPPEQYAALYPRCAAQIRAHHGLPPNCDFGPPPPDVIQGIIHGNSPILLALDHPERAIDVASPRAGEAGAQRR